MNRRWQSPLKSPIDNDLHQALLPSSAPYPLAHHFLGSGLSDNFRNPGSALPEPAPGCLELLRVRQAL